MRRLSLGGAVAPLVLGAVVAVLGAYRSDYSHLNQFISDLGATGTDRAAVMNFMGFVPTGLLMLGFVASTHRLTPRSKLGSVGTMLLALFALGVILAGLVSCDIGCPVGTGSLENRIHNTASPLAFVAGIFGVACVGWSVRRIPEWRWLALPSLLAASGCLVFMLLLVSSLDSRELTGLWQRLFLGTLFAWSWVAGIRLYRHPPLDEIGVSE